MKPSFSGAIRGEAIKVSRQLSFWLMLLGGLVLLGITVVAIGTLGNLPETAKTQPSSAIRQLMDVYGVIFEVGPGIVLFITGSRLIALAASSATLRFAYAREA